MTTGNPSPLTPYVSKLENRRPVSAQDRSLLLDLPATLRRVEPLERFMRQGELADQSVFLIEGLLSRQKAVGGAAQIMSINFPGDAVDLQTLFFERTDHALVAHESSVVAFVPDSAIIKLCEANPVIAKLLWHDTLVDSAIFREWALNIGHRRAPYRIGFAFLEFQTRLAAVGRADINAFELNLTQQELAVWSRDEVTRIDLEDRRVVCPCVCDGFERCFPSERLEVLGEVVGLHEREDVGL